MAAATVALLVVLDGIAVRRAASRPYDPYRKTEEAATFVTHPISCPVCHDPETMRLRVTRPVFLRGVAALARSSEDLVHLPSIGRWRQGDREEDYDPNRLADNGEMRSFVCAQCHAEYGFEGQGNLLAHPWSNGLRAEAIEEYYDDLDAIDRAHERTGARLLVAHHPEFELWSRGLHARAGVACADCHMPHVPDGTAEGSDHHVHSPLRDVHRACHPCHACDEEDLRARAVAIQDRTGDLLLRAKRAVASLIRAIERAAADGLEASILDAARNRHRRAQWRLGFIAAENSRGFHASEEAARVLAEAIDHARKGETDILEARRATEER